LLCNKNGYSMITIEEIDSLKEENFCLKFEIDALAELLIRNESERMVPNFSLEVIEHDHLDRYNLVLEYSMNKDVLEVACGTGYGSYIMATKGGAHSVFACDISEQAIRYASHRYRNDIIHFSIQDAERLILNKKFDLVISFETVEHLTNCNQFLKNIKDCLNTNGFFIVSTPIAEVDIVESPINPYHKQEWGFSYFQKMISEYFVIEKIYLQMYQNEFLNEKIMNEFKKYEIKNKSIKNIIVRKLRRIINGNVSKSPMLLTDWKDRQNFSKIEEFSNQFEISDLGKKYNGYQILVCRKR